MSKENINLPKTAFSMKANLPTREPDIINYWEKIGLYKDTVNRPNFHPYAIPKSRTTKDCILIGTGQKGI